MQFYIIRVFACVALAGIGWPQLLAQEQGGKKDEVSLLKEIDLRGLKLPRAEGSVRKPTEIRTAKELAKAFPDEATQNKISEQVNFEKQYLVFFNWSGSGQDRLNFSVRATSAGGQVNFQYQPGRTRDLRPHQHLFALRKGVEWKADK